MAMDDSTFDLRRLIHPIPPDEFKREYWERRPLIVHRDTPDYYRGLLSLADVDRALSISSVWTSQVRVLRDGKDVPPGDLDRGGLLGSAADLESLYAEYRRGATIVLHFLHERWKPLADLCRTLNLEFSASFQVNVYVTPAREQGLNTHYDTHDVFVLQSEGSKHWRLYEDTPIRLPLQGQRYNRETMKPGRVMAEFDLKPGDLIYIPRGWLHDAVSCESTSLHLTLGIISMNWGGIILRAVESIIESDWRFRESLPMGFARSDALRELAKERLTALLARLTGQLQPASVIQNAAQEALLAGQPALEGHFMDLERVSRINLRTAVRRRAGVPYTFAINGERATLNFHGKAVQLPAYTERDLRFILDEVGEFSAGDLPEALDDAGKLMLVQTLVREGFLTLADLNT